jgi:hypothetical protein
MTTVKREKIKNDENIIYFYFLNKNFKFLVIFLNHVKQKKVIL